MKDGLTFKFNPELELRCSCCGALYHPTESDQRHVFDEFMQIIKVRDQMLVQGVGAPIRTSLEEDYQHFIQTFNQAHKHG